MAEERREAPESETKTGRFSKSRRDDAPLRCCQNAAPGSLQGCWVPAGKHGCEKKIKENHSQSAVLDGLLIPSCAADKTAAGGTEDSSVPQHTVVTATNPPQNTSHNSNTEGEKALAPRLALVLVRS